MLLSIDEDIPDIGTNFYEMSSLERIIKALKAIVPIKASNIYKIQGEVANYVMGGSMALQEIIASSNRDLRISVEDEYKAIRLK